MAYLNANRVKTPLRLGLLRPNVGAEPRTDLQRSDDIRSSHRTCPRVARSSSQRHRRRPPPVPAPPRGQRGFQQAIASELAGAGAKEGE